MAVHLSRENFIPLRVAELVEFLTTGAGAVADPRPLSDAEAGPFRELANRLEAHYHRELFPQLRQLKDAYAPFDPDSDTRALADHDPDTRARALEQLFARAREILVKANYLELPRLEVLKLLEGRTAWGLEMDVSWDVFERIEVFYRGDTVGLRSHRPWWRLFLKEEKVVPEFKRLVLLIKLQPHRRLGKEIDTRGVLLKMFKSLPKPDIEMVLPGTRIKLSKIDKGLIIYPLLSGVGIIAYKVMADVFKFKDYLAVGAGVAVSWSLAVAFAGWGYKAYVSYSNKKTAYSLQLTQSLYFQNIDNNAGVFYRLLDEASEQEVREALLGYYHLWKSPFPDGLTADELDDAVEADLEKRLDLKVDFEIGDALRKLHELGLVTERGGRYSAVPLAEAGRRVAAL